MRADHELILITEEFLRKVTFQLDPYTSKKGQIVKTGRNSVTLLTPSHIQFAKYGRGPGKKPPIKAILDWVKSRGIILGSLSKEGTAYAIQNSISKKGTKGYVQNAPNALEEAITKNYAAYIAKVDWKTTEIISNEVNLVMVKIFPPQIKL